MYDGGVKERVRITDVSPRDGLQNEPGIIPTGDKVRLIELLCATGVDEIEVTSFVSPKWVPQLGDGAEVVRGLLFLPLLPGGGWGKVSSELDWPPPPPARNPVTVGRAQHLRRHETGPEKALWGVLKGKSLDGYKFRRQHPFGPYILDFYCPAERLAVELDGETHRTPEARAHDEVRTRYLSGFGIRVIRFSDDAAVHDPGQVGRVIVAHLRNGRTFPQPPPEEHSPAVTAPPLFSALVPNERGLQGVFDANRAAQRNLLAKVSVFTAASEAFSQKNTNASIAEAIERFRPVVAGAHANALLVRAYVSCIIACPFEGPIAPERVVDVCRRLLDLGIDELDLGDTIGAGTPDSITTLLRELNRTIPVRGGRVPLTLHLHDTFGRAADCVQVALDLGIRSFDGSVAGLGGCPYASKKLPDGTIQRAPGNISTELLARTIRDAGYETGVDLKKLAVAADFAREIVAKSRQTPPLGARS